MVQYFGVDVGTKTCFLRIRVKPVVSGGWRNEEVPVLVKIRIHIREGYGTGLKQVRAQQREMDRC
jgi:hypothetical protein